MPENKLRETVSKLREELNAEKDLSAESSAKLSGILSDIESLLAKSKTPAGDSLPARLAETASDFETSHPRLTAVLGQIAEALSGMGI